DGVLALYPVHLEIQARRSGACPPLRKLSSEVAQQALLLADKYKDDPIFPSAIASIRALQKHAAQNPSFKARHTLLTFGDDGRETWDAIARATGIKLDGTGIFTGHNLRLTDGRTFET